MALLNFPASPTAGDSYVQNSVTYQYNADGYWEARSASGGGGLVGAATAIFSNPDTAIFSDPQLSIPVNLQTYERGGRCVITASGGFKDFEMFVPLVAGGAPLAGGAEAYGALFIQGFTNVRNARFATRTNAKGGSYMVMRDTTVGSDSPLVKIEGLYADWSQGNPNYNSTNKSFDIICDFNPNLTSVTDFSFVFNAGTSGQTKYVIGFVNCALDQTSVDHIFNVTAAAWTNRVVSSATVHAESAIKMNGGTNAAPSAASSAARSTLASAGFTITTN